jgi:curli biogenesis system outer membrane secretion channel CsgG
LKRILILAVTLVSGGLLFSCMNTIQMANLQQMPTNYARSPAFDEKQIWRTVVLPPAAGSMYNLSLTAGLYDYAGMALLRTGRFTLVDRTVVDQLLDEQEFSWSGVVDQATAVQLGKLLGAEAVMTINVTRIAHDSFWDDDPSQRDADLHVKIISVETSEVLYTSMGQGNDFDGAEGALRMALEVALIGLTK